MYLKLLCISVLLSRPVTGIIEDGEFLYSHYAKDDSDPPQVNPHENWKKTEAELRELGLLGNDASNANLLNEEERLLDNLDKDNPNPWSGASNVNPSVGLIPLLLNNKYAHHLIKRQANNPENDPNLNTQLPYDDNGIQ